MRPTAEADWFELFHTPIDPSLAVQHVRGGQNGAIVTFDGFVRDESHGRRTLYLEYEAYEPMALGKMREIGAQAHQKFSIHRMALLHRLGRLEIGETSVFIAVSAPHRVAAFDACRFATATAGLVAQGLGTLGKLQSFAETEKVMREAASSDR